MLFKAVVSFARLQFRELDLVEQFEYIEPALSRSSQKLFIQRYQIKCVFGFVCSASFDHNFMDDRWRTKKSDERRSTVINFQHSLLKVNLIS